MEIKTRVKV